MYELRIQHEGLNAFKIVKGPTAEDAEIKARMQRLIWDQKWAKQQAASALQGQRMAKAYGEQARKELAVSRTRDAEGQVQVLVELLTKACAAPVTFNWESLKDFSPFSATAPTDTVPVEHPTKPIESAFAPKLTFLDSLISSRRQKKQEHAKGLFFGALACWERECKKVETFNVELKEANLSAGKRWAEEKRRHADALAEKNGKVEELKGRYFAKERDTLEFLFSAVMEQSDYPDSFPRDVQLSYDSETASLLLDFELPNELALPKIKEVKYIAKRQEFVESLLSDAWLKRTYDDVLYKITLRTLYELFSSDEADSLKSIVFNGWVRSKDRATGAPTHACILSVLATKDEYLAINLTAVDPRACFKKLKGISAAKLAELTPVRPIMALDMNDDRFVAPYDVVNSIDDKTNLAAMDWLDFENLIRELFEQEFSQNGGEVKITQASRDGGVDAIAFDPDPIRGGKIVIQAKRYTNVVGVSAVRDLYGTVHNEGANKGILVTTSDFGPDAYEFAKGKPLTLLSGSELLYLLERHGHRAKIDIHEAKQLAAERLP